MKPAARRFDVTDCAQHKRGPGVVLPLGNPDIFINGQPAIRLADQANCPGGVHDVVSEGAASVRIGGLPAATIDHVSSHRARIFTGSENVNIGGPTFALPSNVRVGGDAEYQNKVVRDLWLLSETPTGKEIFDRMARAGGVVEIVPGLANECAGGRVYYNPDLVAVSIGRSGGAVNAPPQTALGHELAHAVRIAEGKAPPEVANQKQYANEEEIVRGTGGRAWEESISENRLRDDLGVPQRGEKLLDREKQTGPIDGPENLRPGGY